LGSIIEEGPPAPLRVTGWGSSPNCRKRKVERFGNGRDNCAGQ
jgi:hypothetical protein